ncbi:Na/Pi cotransporter family protein [Candidatus Thorarchaeota archaeon]|nr:MAG: Na/Pi cotransporter family protein [Candidatus Thorarchaeota archaeon]
MFICSICSLRHPLDMIKELTIAFEIIGGLALFMYGVSLLREALGKISGKQIVRILEKVSDDPIRGIGAGTVATVMTQSSSITVLTLIGFVNAGMMTFRQSVNVMLGSEIGTTVTAQIVSFDIGSIFWPLIAIGFFMKLFSKKERFQLIGTVIFSIGLLFLAMDFMKQGAAPLTEDYPFFKSLINDYGTIPIFGILIGALIAGVTQSSSATTCLVIAMGSAGAIDLSPAIALVMGANIGTCFLELFAGIGATTPAKRTAVAQTIINLVGVSLFLPFLAPFTNIVTATSTELPRQIANAHTIFNVIVSLIFIPLVGLLVRFCEKILPDKEGEVIGKHFFDDEMLHIPQVALLEAERETIRTAEKTLEMIKLSKTGLLNKNLDDARKVMQLEDEVDESCRDTEAFIDKIREEELNQEDIIWRIKLLAILTDIERVGDLASNIGEFVIDKLRNGISFSNEGSKNLEEMFDLVEETYSTSIKSLKTKEKELAKVAERLEDQVDVLERKLKAAHVLRVQAGICNPEADQIFVETLRNLERIGDHADNIAYDIIMKI